MLQGVISFSLPTMQNPWQKAPYVKNFTYIWKLRKDVLSIFLVWLSDLSPYLYLTHYERELKVWFYLELAGKMAHSIQHPHPHKIYCLCGHSMQDMLINTPPNKQTKKKKKKKNQNNKQTWLFQIKTHYSPWSPQASLLW